MRKFSSIFIVSVLIGCKGVDVYKSFELSDFNLEAGYDFVQQVDALTSIENISLVDVKNDGKEFKVNDQRIFIDSTYANQPNFYSYKKRAIEIGVKPSELLESLRKFYKIKVNEFQRSEDAYVFKVEKYLNTREKGYLYAKGKVLNPGDTITYQKNTKRVVIINKKIDERWYGYEEAPYF